MQTVLAAWGELGCGLTRNRGDLGGVDWKGADLLPPAKCSTQSPEGAWETHLQLTVYTSEAIFSPRSHMEQSSLHREARVALSTAMMGKHLK